MSLNKIVLMTAAASVIVTMTTGMTFAKTYEALYQVNIHKIDSKASKVVGALYEGERVNVSTCDDDGWCFISHKGPSGWVQMAALERAAGGSTPTVVIEGGFDFPHKSKPPVVVDPGPKHPIVGGIYNPNPPKTLDPGSSQGNGNIVVMQPWPGLKGSGNSNGGNHNGGCLLHTCLSQP